MAIQDDVLQQYEQTQKSRNWLEKGIDRVKDITSSEESKQNRKEQDMRQALLDVKKRYADEKLSEGFDEKYSQLQKEQEELIKTAQEAKELDEFSDDYKDKIDYLKNKKFAFDEKLKLFGGVKTLNDEHQAKQEYIRMQRGPMQEYFTDDAQYTTFINNNIKSSVYDDEGNFLINSPLAQAKYGLTNSIMGNMLSQVDDKVQEMVRRKIINSPDEFYTSPEFTKLSSELRNNATKILESNKDTLVKSDGSIDGEVMRDLIYNNEDVKGVLDKYEGFVENIDDTLKTSRKQDAKRWREKGYAGLVGAVDFVTEDIVNEGLESLSSAFSKDNVAFFGDEQQKALVAGFTNTDTVLQQLGRSTLQNPGELGLLAVEVAGTIFGGAGAGALGSRLARLGGSASKIKALSRFGDKIEDVVDATTGLGNLVKAVRVKAPAVADEILKGTIIDLTVDAWVNEYDNAGMNLFFGGLPGLLTKAGTSVIDDVVKGLSKLDGVQNKAGYLKSRGAIVPESFDFDDATAVRNLVEDTFKVLKEPTGASKMFGLSYVSDAIKENPQIFSEKFYDDLYRKIIPSIDDPLRPVNKELMSTAKIGQDILNDTTLNDVEKITKLQETTINMFEDIGSEFVNKVMQTNAKSVVSNSLVRGLAETFVERLDMPRQEALSVALQSFFNKASTPQDVIASAIDVSVDIPGKVSSITKEIEDFGKSVQYIEKSENIIGDIARKSFEGGQQQIPASVTTDTGFKIQPERLTKADSVGIDEINMLTDLKAGGGIKLDKYAESMQGYFVDNFDYTKMVAGLGKVSKDFTRLVDSMDNLEGFAKGIAKFTKAFDTHTRNLAKNYSSMKAKEFATGFDKTFLTVNESLVKKLFGDEFVSLHTDEIRKVLGKKNAIQKIFDIYARDSIASYIYEPSKYLELVSRIFANTDMTSTELAYIKAWHNDIYKYIKGNSDAIYNVLYVNGTRKLSTSQLDNLIDGFELSKTAVDVGLDDFELPASITASLNSINRRALNNYQKTLLNGFGIQGLYHLPKLDTVVRGLYKSIASGEDYVIPFAYLTSDGIDLLRMFIPDQKQLFSYINKSLDSQVKQFHDIGSTLFQRYFTGDRLYMYKDIDGASTSVFDLFNQLSPRLSEGIVGKATSGVAYTPVMTLSKYAIRSDEAYKSAFTQGLDAYFSGKAKRSPRLKTIYKALNDFIGEDTMGQSLMKLHDDVVNQFASMTGVYDENIVGDIVNPLLYRADEYLHAVYVTLSNNPDHFTDYEKMVNVLVKKFLNRDSVIDTIGNQAVAYANEFLKGGVDLQALILDPTIQNINLSTMESFMRNYMDGIITDISINTDDFAHFIYNNFGYGLFAESHGFTGDVVKLYGNHIADGLRGYDVTDDIIKEVNSAININSIYDNGLEDAMKSVKKILSGNKIPDSFMKDIEDYVRITLDHDRTSARNILIDEMVKRFTSAPEVSAGELLPKGIDETRKSIDARNDLVEDILDDQQIFYRNAVGNILEEQLLSIENPDQIIRFNNLKDMLGVSTKQAKEILHMAGFNDDIIEEYVSKKKMTSKEVISKLSDEVRVGNVDVSLLMKNKVFRDAVNSVMKNGGYEMPTQGVWYTVDNEGKIISRINKKGGVMNEIFNAILPLNMRALYDNEAQDIMAKWFAKQQTGIVFKPTSKFIKGGKNVSANAYLHKVTDGIKEHIIKSGMTVDEYKSVAQRIFGHTEKDGKVSDLINNIFIESEPMGTLAKMLSEYKNDMLRFRKDGLPYISQSDKVPSFLTEGDNINDLVNRLRGSWTFVSNDDMERLTRKFAPVIKEGRYYSGIKKFLLSDFVKDTFYGGLFDVRNILEGGSGVVSQASMLLLYNPTQLGKGIQQTANNMVHIKSILNGYSFDSQALDGMISYIDNKLNYSLFKGNVFETIVGQEGGRLGRAWQEILQKTSVLYWSDALAQQQVIKSSMTQALYPIYESYGQKGVDEFIEKIASYREFAQRFDVDKEIEFTNKYAMRKKIMTFSENPSKDLIEYERHARFVTDQFESFLSKTRTALGTFYVMDNIRELGATRLIDNNRALFIFKKRALGKMGEYGLRFAEEYKKARGGNFLAKLTDMPVMNMFAADVARNLYLAYNVEKLSGGDMDMSGFVMNMSVPLVAMKMSFADAITSGFKTTKNYMEFDAGFFSSVVMGTLETTRGLIGTAFLYHDILIREIENAIATGASFPDIEDKLTQTIKAFYASSFQDSMTKFFYDEYRGVLLGNNITGDVITNALETMFNVRSLDRRQYDELIQNMYTASSSADGGLGNRIGNFLSRSVPILRATTYTTSRISPLLDALESYTSENGLDMLFNRFAGQLNPEKLGGLIDKYEGVSLQKKLSKQDVTLLERFINGEFDEIDVLDMGFEERELGENLAIFNKVVSLLRYQSNDFASGLGDAAISSISDQQRAELESTFIQFLKDNTKKYSTNVEGAVDNFLIARTDLGTNIPMGDYLSAMNTAIKQFVKEEYVGDSVDAKQDVFLDKKGPAYRKYVNIVRSMQKEILISSWDVIASNPYVGQELKKDMLMNARDLPFDVDKGISTRTVMSYLIAANDIKDVLERDGYASDEFLNRFNIVYRNTLNAIGGLDGKDKIKGYKNVLNVFNNFNQAIDDSTTNPLDKSLMRMGLSYALVPFVDDINKANPQVLQETIAVLGDDFTRMVDTVTYSSPLDEKTAMEKALDVSLSGAGEGGSKKKTRFARGKKAKDNTVKLAKGLEKVKQFAYKAKNYSGTPTTSGTRLSVKSGGPIPGYTYVKAEPITVEPPKPLKPTGSKVVGTSGKTEDLGGRVVSKSRFSIRKVYRPKKISKSTFFTKGI